MFYYSSTAFGPSQSPPTRDGGVSVLALPAYQGRKIPQVGVEDLSGL